MKRAPVLLQGCSQPELLESLRSKSVGGTSDLIENDRNLLLQSRDLASPDIGVVRRLQQP